VFLLSCRAIRLKQVYLAQAALSGGAGWDKRFYGNVIFSTNEHFFGCIYPAAYAYWL